MITMASPRSMSQLSLGSISLGMFFYLLITRTRLPFEAKLSVEMKVKANIMVRANVQSILRIMITMNYNGRKEFSG